MTIDQRLEFLLQSTESLHATAQEHSLAIDKLTGKLNQIANTMSDLAIAVLQHERRLGKLDGGGEMPPTQN